MTTDSDKGAPLPERAETDGDAAGRPGEAAAIEVEVGAPEAAGEAPERGGPGEAAEPAPLGEIERLKLELELSQEHARTVYGRLKEEHERLLRTAADHENYKKRAAREREEITRYGNERLVKELLPVIDNLERALAASASAGGAGLASGVEMTLRLLEEALGRFGVKGFSARGQPFDPRFHEALMSVATGDVPPGTVVEEQQRGFFMHERLIRPAAVVVAAAPPREPEESPGAAGDAAAGEGPGAP